MTDFGGGGDAEFFIPIHADFEKFDEELDKGLTRAIRRLKPHKLPFEIAIPREISKQVTNQFKNLKVAVPFGASPAEIERAINHAVKQVRLTAKIPISKLLGNDQAEFTRILNELKAKGRKEAEAASRAGQTIEQYRAQGKRSGDAFVSAHKEAMDKLHKQGIAIPAGAKPQQIIETATVSNDAALAVSNLTKGFAGLAVVAPKAGAGMSASSRSARNLGDAFGNAFQSGAVLERALSTLGLDTLPVLGPAFIRVAGTMQAFNRLVELGNPKVDSFIQKLGLGGKFSGVKVGGLALAVQAFTATMVIGVREAAKAEDELAQLEQALISTGRSGLISAKEVDEFARSMERFGAFSRTAQLEAADVAVTFDQISDPLALMSVGMDVATREGTSLADAVTRIGKVIQDPSRATTLLGTAIRGLTTAEREHIKSLQEQGQFSEAARVVIERLRRTSEGAARVQRETLAGAFAVAKNAMTTMMADAAQPLIPVLLAIAKGFGYVSIGIGEIVKLFNNLHPIIKVAIGLFALYRIRLLAFAAAKAVATAAAVVFQAVTGMGTIALRNLAIGLAAATTVVGAYGYAVTKTDETLKKATNSFDDLGDAVNEANDVTPAAVRGLKALGLEASETAFSYDTLKQAVRQYADEQEKKTDIELARLDLLESQRDAAVELKQAEAELAATRAASAAVSERADTVEVDLIKSRLSHEQAVESLNKAEKDNVAAREDLVEATEDHIAVTQGYLRLLEEQSLSEDERIEAQAKITDAQLDLKSAYRDTKSAVLDLEEAILDLTDAQIAEERATFIANRTLQVFGANSSQYRHALEKQKRAKIEEERATLGVEAAQDGIIASQSQYQQQLYTTNALLNGYAEGTDAAREANRQLHSAQESAKNSSIALRLAHEAERDAAYELAFNTELYNQKLAGNLPLSNKVLEAEEKLNDQRDRANALVRDLAKNQKEYNDQLQRMDDINRAMIERQQLALAQKGWFPYAYPGASSPTPGLYKNEQTGQMGYTSNLPLPVQPQPGWVPLDAQGNPADSIPRYGMDQTVNGKPISRANPLPVEVVNGNLPPGAKTDVSGMYFNTPPAPWPPQNPAQAAAWGVPYSPNPSDYNSGKIPKPRVGYAGGGTVPGPIGQPRLAIVHGGEKITPAGQTPSSMSSMSASGIYVMSAIARLHDAIRQLAIAQAAASAGHGGRPLAVPISIDGMTLANAVIPYIRVVQAELGQGTI